MAVKSTYIIHEGIAGSTRKIIRETTELWHETNNVPMVSGNKLRVNEAGLMNVDREQVGGGRLTECRG